MKRPTIGTLLQQLAAEGLLPGFDPGAAGDDGPAQLPRLVQGLGEIRRQAPAPWYVRALVGLGAWVASLLLVAFMMLAEIIDSDLSALLGGLLLVAVVMVLRRWLGRRAGAFSGQATLALGLAGQALVILGFGAVWDSAAAAAFMAMVVSCLFFMLYPDRVQQLISVLLFGFSLAVLLEDLDLPSAIDISTLVLGGLAFRLWVHRPRLEGGRWGHFVAPAAYGLVIAVLCLLLTSLADPHEVPSAGWPATVGFTIGLLLLARRVRGELLQEAGKPPDPILVVTVTALVLLGAATLQAPGVTTAIAVLILAFYRRSPMLMGLALVFLPVFALAFYYHLQISLLAKSGVLVAGGVVLLGLRSLLLRPARSRP